MKKIIHLSDLHVGHKDLTRKLGKIVSRMIFHKKPAENYVVVVTGDIVEDANDEGVLAEASVHLDRLKKAGFHVLVVMGNHDCGSGSFGKKRCHKDFKEHFYGDRQFEFPKLDLIENIAFIGLDSMEDELNLFDAVGADGELGSKQRKRLKAMLTSPDVVACQYRVVYLHHHPFAPRFMHHLKDSKKLGKILKKNNISALLFGHNHDGLPWNGHWGIKRVYDAGSSTGKKGKTGPHRVIDLSKDPAFDYDARFLE